MKPVLICCALAALLSGAALAQTAEQRPTSDPLAVTPVSPKTETTDSDVVRSRIEGVGYSDVKDISRDSDGIWHARALKNHTPVDIAIDKGGRIKPEAETK